MTPRALVRFHFNGFPGDLDGAGAVPGQWFDPGDEVPAEVLARIDADKLTDAPAPVEPETSTEAPAAPPRSGPGSGLAAWLAYAEALEVAVPDGATREQVIEAIEKAAPAAE